jgi:hypothetical protein
MTIFVPAAFAVSLLLFFVCFGLCIGCVFVTFNRITESQDDIGSAALATLGLAAATGSLFGVMKFLLEKGIN